MQKHGTKEDLDLVIGDISTISGFIIGDVVIVAE